MSTVHVLKTLGTAWDAVQRGEKTFEVRRNDRFFQRGDIVRLQRLSDLHGGLQPKTQPLDRRIGWMLQGRQFGVEPGFVVFSLESEALATARRDGAREMREAAKQFALGYIDTEAGQAHANHAVAWNASFAISEGIGSLPLPGEAGGGDG